MSNRKFEIVMLRNLATSHRALADYVAEEKLSWKAAWDVVRRFGRHMSKDRELEGDYYEVIRKMQALDLPPEEFVKAFNKHADDFDREADQLEKEQP